MTFPWLRGVERGGSDHAMRQEGAIMLRVVDAIECRKSCRKPGSGHFLPKVDSVPPVFAALRPTRKIKPIDNLAGYDIVTIVTPERPCCQGYCEERNILSLSGAGLGAVRYAVGLIVVNSSRDDWRKASRIGFQ